MNMQKEFLDMVCADIKRIEESNSLSSNEQLKLHRQIDGRYQACIKDWYLGLWAANAEGTHLAYHLLQDRPRSVQENLEMMKSKLESFQYQANAIKLPEIPQTQVNVTTNVMVNLSFEEARQKVEDMTALNQEQTDEVIEKIDELEAISKEDISRKKKWEKVKPILAFALDKGADIATAIMALVLQMKLGLL